MLGAVVAVGVGVGVAAGVGVDVAVGVGVCVGLGATLAVGAGVGVAEALGVGVGVALGIGVALGEGLEAAGPLVEAGVLLTPPPPQAESRPTTSVSEPPASHCRCRMARPGFEQSGWNACIAGRLIRKITDGSAG
jgi:hypothetical protein